MIKVLLFLMTTSVWADTNHKECLSKVKSYLQRESFERPMGYAGNTYFEDKPRKCLVSVEREDNVDTDDWLNIRLQRHNGYGFIEEIRIPFLDRKKFETNRYQIKSCELLENEKKLIVTIKERDKAKCKREYRIYLQKSRSSNKITSIRLYDRERQVFGNPFCISQVENITCLTLF
jgi:hypothetical protein